MTLSESVQRHRFHLLLTLLLLAGLYSSVIPGMVVQWYQDDNYSHGFLIPVIAGYFLYQRLDILKETRAVPSNLGLFVIVIALCQLIVASLCTEYFTLRLSLVVMIAGMVLYFFGAEVFKSVRLPILYLIFMIPLPYVLYNGLTFPLKQFISRISVGFLKSIGIAVLQEGNIIILASTTLEVADSCSGIRSLVSLLAIATAYAFYLHFSRPCTWIIILSAVPLAIFSNALRVIATGILVQHWGARAAEGMFHEMAGMAAFALSLILIVALGTMMHRMRP
jgi:exosortase